MLPIIIIIYFLNTTTDAALNVRSPCVKGSDGGGEGGEGEGGAAPPPPPLPSSPLSPARSQTLPHLDTVSPAAHPGFLLHPPTSSRASSSNSSRKPHHDLGERSSEDVSTRKIFITPTCKGRCVFPELLKAVVRRPPIMYGQFALQSYFIS